MMSGSILMPLGLSDALITVTAGDDGGSWALKSFDISDYIGSECRLVFKYLSGTDYTGDVQLDDINFGSNDYDPEDGAHSFERSSSVGSAPSTYSSVSWEALPTTASSTEGLFNRYDDVPASSFTGIAAYTGNYHFYAETSTDGSGFSNKYFWLRSPAVTITNGTLNFRLGKYGATCGQVDVYIEVI